MRRTPSRVPCHATGTGRRVLLLSVLGSLVLLAGCGVSAAGVGGTSVPSPSGTAASHRLAPATCSAALAALPTPSARSPTAPPGAHRSYALLALGPLPRQLVYHPGATVHFTWCALPDRYQVSTQPVPKTLTAGFIGPFATRAAATADRVPPTPSAGRMNGPPAFPPPGPLVASTIPIHTTTWSGADETAPLTLPTTLAPGYYLFFTQDAVSVQACLAVTVGGCGGNDSQSGIIQITPA